MGLELGCELTDPRGTLNDAPFVAQRSWTLCVRLLVLKVSTSDTSGKVSLFFIVSREFGCEFADPRTMLNETRLGEQCDLTFFAPPLVPKTSTPETSAEGRLFVNVGRECGCEHADPPGMLNDVHLVSNCSWTLCATLMVFKASTPDKSVKERLFVNVGRKFGGEPPLLMLRAALGLLFSKVAAVADDSFLPLADTLTELPAAKSSFGLDKSDAFGRISTAFNPQVAKDSDCALIIGGFGAFLPFPFASEEFEPVGGRSETPLALDES